MADSMETPKPTTQNKKEDKKGGVPTLSDTTQTLRNPAFKVKDLSARTLVDRFKQFRKKDLAFILAGLGVLFTAPMAERYLMSPTHGSSDVFKEGWGFRPGQGGLGAGGSPFDTGENGFATGNQVGENGDIITPANFRDPSSLILGPEAEAQPPATTSEAPAGNSGSGSNWKNALAEAGGNAAKNALGRAGLPMPPLTLSKNMLSGIAGLSPQGGSEHYSLPPLGGGHVPNGPNVSNSLGAVKANPNLKGVGPWSEKGNGTGSIEALKTAGGNAASQFSNPSANKGLQNAAAVQMPSANPNRFGSAGADKGMGNNSVKMSKNLGESLAFMAAKMNMQKSIDLQWKLAEKKAMMWPNIEEKALTGMITKPLGAVEDALGQGIAGFLGGPSANDYQCSDGKTYHALTCPDAASGGPKPPSSGWCYYQNSIYSGGKNVAITQVASGCSKSGSGGNATNNAKSESSASHATPEVLKECAAIIAANNSGNNVTTGSQEMKDACAALKDANGQEKTANGAMGTTNATIPPTTTPATGSGDNYDVQKSPVRGFVLNPIHSLLWAFAGQIFDAPAWASQQSASACTDASSCLTDASKKLSTEISDMQTALKPFSKNAPAACQSFLSGIQSDIQEECTPNGFVADNVAAKQIDTDVKNLGGRCFSRIQKQIGSAFQGKIAKSDVNIENGISQTISKLAQVRKGNEAQIGKDQDKANTAVTKIESEQGKATIGNYADESEKAATQIAGIYTSVDRERERLNACATSLGSQRSAAQTDMSGIKKRYQRIKSLLSSGQHAATTDASGAGVQSTAGCAEVSVCSGQSINSSLDSINQHACNFRKDVSAELKKLADVAKGLKQLGQDASKPNCPSSVTTALTAAHN